MSNILNTLFWLAIICTAIAFFWYFRDKNIAQEKGNKVTHKRRNLGYGLLALTVVLGIGSYSYSNSASSDISAPVHKKDNSKVDTRIDDATYLVHALFDGEKVTNRLAYTTTKDDIDEAQKAVDDLPNSMNGKKKLQSEMKIAHNRFKKDRAYYDSIDSSAAASSDKEASSDESDNEESSSTTTHKSNKVKVGGLSYSKVSLETFTANPDKYEGKNIQTSGSVYYIQKNPDNKTMYFVILVPTDEYSTSGYADGNGTVAQIDVDTMKENNIKTDDQITVDGGGLVGTVSLNGKEIASSIIVDYVK